MRRQVLIGRVTKTVYRLAPIALVLLLSGPAVAQQSNAQYLTGLYFGTLGVPPDFTGWAYWYQTLQAKTQSQAQVANFFLTSSEYFSNCSTVLNNNDNGKNTCPGSTCVTQYPSGTQYPANYSCQAHASPTTGLLDNQDFLTLLYWDALGRPPDPSGWANWYTNSLQATPPVPQTTVVSGFLGSSEFGGDYNVTAGTVTPTAFALNGNGAMTITYSAPGGTSYIGSGSVMIASAGDPTVYNAAITGCQVEWWSSQSVSLWAWSNGANSSETSGTMGAAGTLSATEQSPSCSLNLAGSSYNASTGMRTLALNSNGSPSVGAQPLWSYGSDNQGWANLPWTPWTISYTVNTAPSGLQVTLDGLTCNPCSLQVASQHTVATTATQAGPTGTQYVFSAWPDGTTSPGSDTIVIYPQLANYTASFGAQYLLATAGSPGSSGTVVANPSSTTGYYDAGTTDSANRRRQLRFAIHGMDWGMTGVLNPQNILMSAPQSVTASFAQSVVITPTNTPAATVAGRTTTATFSVSGPVGGTINFTVAGTPAYVSPSVYTSPSSCSGSCTLTVSLAALTEAVAGNYSVTVTGTVAGTNPALQGSSQFTMHIQDFTVAISPLQQLVTCGQSTTATVQVNGLNGASGSFFVSAQWYGVNPGGTLSFPAGGSTVTLAAGSPATLTIPTTALTCNGYPNDTQYWVQVSAYSDTWTVTRSALAYVSGQSAPNSNYLIQTSPQPSPSGLQIMVDGVVYTNSHTLSVPSNGLGHLFSVATPQTVNGVKYVFTSWSDGSASAAHAVIAAGSSPTTYTAYFSTSAPDFTVTTTAASSALIQAGGAVTYTVSVNSVNGFSTPVTLATWPNQSGVVATLSSTTVTPGQTAILTVVTPPNMPMGHFTVPIVGTAGSAQRLVAAIVHVECTDGGDGGGGGGDDMRIDNVTVSADGMTIFISGQNFGDYIDSVDFNPGLSVASMNYSDNGGEGDSIVLELSSAAPAGLYNVSVAGCFEESGCEDADDDFDVDSSVNVSVTVTRQDLLNFTASATPPGGTFFETVQPEFYGILGSRLPPGGYGALAHIMHISANRAALWLYRAHRRGDFGRTKQPQHLHALEPRQYLFEASALPRQLFVG